MSPDDRSPPPSATVDRWGALASSLCAVHCAASALLPAALAAVGLGALLSHEVEWVFTGLALLLAGLALRTAWRRQNARLALGLLLFGIVGLVAGRLIEEAGEGHAHHGAHVAEHHADREPHGDAHAHHAEAPGHAHDGIGLGAAIGILGGLLVAAGHVTNLRQGRSAG